jgi:hypothetical protein
MSQNISSAVMQQRSEPHDSLDYFPTPLWATRALCEHVIGDGNTTWKNYQAYDPACGEGHMARALGKYFKSVMATDIHPYGYGGVCDFLFPANGFKTDWVITNPPFRLAEQFIETACSMAQTGVAMLVRIAFLEGVGRYNNLFIKNPPSIIAQFSERVPMFKGRVDAKGSTATAYCWLVWRDWSSKNSTRFMWIPPCRKRLEREGDYS